MQRRQLDFRDFDALTAEVERLKSGYTKVGNWELGEVCHHLGRTMQSSLDGFKEKAPWLLRVHGCSRLAAMLQLEVSFKSRSNP